MQVLLLTIELPALVTVPGTGAELSKDKQGVRA